MGCQLDFEGGQELPIVIVDGGSTSELGVLVCNNGQPFVWDVPATSHVSEKRHDIIGPLGTAERQNQKSIDVHLISTPQTRPRTTTEAALNPGRSTETRTLRCE